jgi:hypothetical protein
MVVRIRDDSVRRRLLGEHDLTLQKAVDIYRATEQTQSHIDALKSATIPIHAVRKGPKGKKDRNNEKARKSEEKFSQKGAVVQCKYCGMARVRDKRKRSALRKSCNKCDKLNHFAKVCKSSINTHAVDTEELCVGAINQKNKTDGVCSTDDKWNITVDILNRSLEIKLDTGAKCNMLSKSVITILDSSIQLKRTHTRLVSYTGNILGVEVTIILPVHYKSKQSLPEFYVVNKPVQAILGLRACEEMKFTQRIEEMSKTSVKAECEFFNVYEDVFSTSSVGCLSVTHHIEIDRNVKPVVHAQERSQQLFVQRCKKN